MTRISRIAWVIFSLFVVYGATIPFRFTTDPAFVAGKWSRVPFNPLIAADTHRRVSIPDVVQNVLFFIPFGVFGLLAGGRRPRFDASRVLFVTGAATAVSVAVEALQLFTVDRVPSTTDVLTNGTGALIGAAGASLAMRASIRILPRPVDAGVVNRRSFHDLLVAAIVLCVGAWQPFDVTLDVGTLARAVRALQRDVWQAGMPSDEGAVWLRGVLFAVAACVWFAAMGRPRPARLGAALGLVSVFGLEASQIAIASRRPGLEEAMVAGAGVLVGAALWTVNRPRGDGLVRVWLALLVVATAAAAAMQNLTPFTVAPAYQAYGRLPFFGDDQLTTFETLSHVIELVLMYFPLGFCFARESAGTGRAVVTVMLVTLAVAAPIEYFQGWIVGRYPDVTDVGVSVAGGLLGVWIGRRGVSIFTPGR